MVKNRLKIMADEEKKEGVSEFDATVLQSEDELAGKKGPRGGSPHVIIIDGPHQGLKFSLQDGDNAVGRLMGSEILLEDQSVSRRHAIISRTSEGWTVEDSGSKNGTFVNNQKLTEKAMVGHGDVVQVGIYSLRLITKEVSKEEEAKPLPPDWEGKTVMMSANPDEETATTAEPAVKEKTAQGVSEEEKKGLAVPEEEESEAGEKKRPFWYNIILIIVLLGVFLGGAAYVYFKFFAGTGEKKPPKIEKVEKKQPEQKGGAVRPEGKPAGEQAEGTETPPPPVEEKLPNTIPVFIDFASSPLPAKVTFQGKDYGTTPVKIQAKLDVDQIYKSEAEFDLVEINEKYKEEITFEVKRDKTVIPVLFKGPIGVLKVMELPRDIELYLEGYFIYNPFNAKTAKVDNVVFGKPVYLPYGKYIIELRGSKELAGGSGSFIRDITYKREILISEDNPVFILKIAEKDLTEFPVEILSIPAGADVFVDAKKVGQTPFKGIFPLGEHTLSLRKDGYFEYTQDLKVDVNTPFKTEIELRTTVAGEKINTGKHLMQKGQHKEAISILTEVFSHTPTPGETAEARYLLGSAFIHLGDLATAESYLKQSMEHEEMKHPSQLGLVSVYHGMGRTEEAIPHLIDVLINAKNEEVRAEARREFSVISPMKSIMYVKTEPDGAKVYLNDKLLDQLTPMILPDLSLGNYKLHIEKEGYIAQDLNIKISVNEFNPVLVTLKPVPE